MSCIGDLREARKLFLFCSFFLNDQIDLNFLLPFYLSSASCTDVNNVDYSNLPFPFPTFSDYCKTLKTSYGLYCFLVSWNLAFEWIWPIIDIRFNILPSINKIQPCLINKLAHIQRLPWFQSFMVYWKTSFELSYWVARLLACDVKIDIKTTYLDSSICITISISTKASSEKNFFTPTPL